MSPFVRVNPGDLIQAQNLNQVIGSLNGTTGQGVPIAQVSVNDASNYALSVQNGEATNSRAINVVKSDGTLLIRGDATGVSLGSPLNLTAGSIGTAPIADGAITNQKLGADTARANLLTNGGFEVWQRGNGPFTATGAYSADRWIINLGPPSTVSLSRDSANTDGGGGYCAAVTYTHSAASNLQQSLIEISTQLRGKTVSASIRIRTSTANAVRLWIWDNVSGFRTGAYHSGGGAYETLTVSATIASGAVNMSIGLDLMASCTAYVDNAMLVVGTVPATYAPLHPADDLARCLRYYEKVKCAARFIATAGSQSGMTPIPFKTTMAITPTTTLGTADMLTNVQGSPSFPTTSADGGSFNLVSNAAGDTYWTGPVTLESNP